MDARFSDYQTRMLRIARHMDQLNQAIQLRARQPASDGEIAPLAHNLTQVRSTLLVCLVQCFFWVRIFQVYLSMMIHFRIPTRVIS